MKKTVYLVLFSCVMLFQSCFEIIEQVYIKNDGSGDFQVVLNLSKSKTKLNSMLKMKTVNGHDVPSKEDIKKRIASTEQIIKQTPGISNVKTTLDFDNYIATLSCSFSKISSLNTAVKSISEKTAVEKIYDFNSTTKIFSRVNLFSLKDEYHKMSNADREIFANANYTSIFRFDSEIVSASNKESKVAGNKKAVMLKLNALDIMTSKKSIENKINLTK